MQATGTIIRNLLAYQNIGAANWVQTEASIHVYRHQSTNSLTRMRVIGLAGWSGAGKTTLLRKLIPLLSGRGLEVSTLKHAHHSFDIDQPGKDSWEHRQAGAKEVLVVSSARWALMHELRIDTEPTLAELLRRMSPVDLVLVEGFKRDRHPKIEIYRTANEKPLLYPDDPTIIAIASDMALPGLALPLHHLDDIEAIADTIQSGALEIGAVDWAGSRDGKGTGRGAAFR